MKPRTGAFQIILLAVFLFGIFVPWQNVCAEVKEVKIGIILPLSGSLAPIGQDMKNGAELFVETVNNSGGIKSLQGAKINLVFADSTGKPDVGMSEAERLINREKVSALMGAFQSAVTYTSTEVAERYQVPYLTSVAVMPDITGRGFKYVFRNTTPSSLSTKMRTEFVAEMEKQYGQGKRYTIGQLNENSDWGMSYKRLYDAYVKDSGRTQVYGETYSYKITDATPLVVKLKNSKPDVLFLACYLSDGFLLHRGFAEHRVNTNIISSGAEHGSPTWLKNVGRLTDYQIWTIPWAIRVIDLKPWIKPINEAYKKKYGDDLGAWSASMYQDISILYDALERAASDDREKIRDALAATKITDPDKIMVPHKLIEFGPDGQNPHAQDLLIQTVDFKHHIVWPPQIRTPDYKVVWPQPTWEEKIKMGIQP